MGSLVQSANNRVFLSNGDGASLIQKLGYFLKYYQPINSRNLLKETTHATKKIESLLQKKIENVIKILNLKKNKKSQCFCSSPSVR